jgi:hypothetical protein
MSKAIAAAIKWSSADFGQLVWPTLAPLLGGGELLPVETVTANDFANELDRTAGIDAWIVQRGRHVFGLASRVQWLKPWRAPYNTFSTRMKVPSGRETEYDKRVRQIATPGSIVARWTTQAYVECQCPHYPPRHEEGTHQQSRRLLTAGVAETAPVIAAVGLGIGYEKTNDDGSRFWCTPWAELWTRGCQSLTIRHHDGHWRRRSEVP